MSYPVVTVRHCSRTACSQPATTTLTYVYADSTVVLGPLATYAEPHSYDLCAEHAGKFTAPRKWEVLRLESPDTTHARSKDDLLAIADAVRVAGQRSEDAERSEATAGSDGPHETGTDDAGRHGHLRVVKDQ